MRSFLHIVGLVYLLVTAAILVVSLGVALGGLMAQSPEEAVRTTLVMAAAGIAGGILMTVTRER